MQIHELNNFSGTPGDIDFLATDNGTDTSKISAKNLLKGPNDKITDLQSKKVNQPLDAYNQPTNGTNGQLLRTKGDGKTEWVNEGLPTDAQTAQAVSDWLDDHPEATTTVEDGSLTEDKFANSLKIKTIKDYVTPEMFGAVGDGVADDKAAFQDALLYSIDNEIPLYLGKKYKIPSPIDLSNKGNVNLYIFGSFSERKYVRYLYEDNVGDVSAVYCPNGFIENSTLYGTIENVCFYSKESERPVLFDNDQLHFKLNKDYLINFTYAIKDSTCNMVSINECLCLAINNFIYNSTFVDSRVSKSYINGGSLNSTGIFMYLSDCNGSVIVDSFVDFYRIMYAQTASNVTLVIISSNNQYQGFRYFETLEPGIMSSVNDSFAYCDEAYSTAQGYAADTVTDTITQATVTVKPCIAYFGQRGFKKYKNANLLKRYDNVLFVHDLCLYEYEGTAAEFDYNANIYTNPTEQILSCTFRTGTGTTNKFKISPYKCDIIRDVNAVSDTWLGNNPSPYVFGEYVRYAGNIYQVVPYYYDASGVIRIGGYKFKQINAL